MQNDRVFGAEQPCKLLKERAWAMTWEELKFCIAGIVIP
jgi:hypothetical protein